MTRPLDVARFPPPWLRERTGSVSPADSPLSVTFPATRIVSRVQVALGADLSADPLTWPWADITSKVRQDLGISLTTGRRDEASTVTTGTAQLKLDNRDGRFSRRNPTGPYYGLLSKNTPIWITIDAGSGEKTRLEAFVNEWPTRWSDLSATDSTVTIQCAGILRRLAQGEVFKSPMRRAALASSPVAYWPLEDGSDATAALSGLPNGRLALVTEGTVGFGAFTDLPGSVTTPDLSAGFLTADLSGGSSTSWHVEFALKLGIVGSAVARVYAVGGSDTHAVWRLFTPGSGGDTTDVFITNAAGNVVTTVLIATSPTNFENEWHHYAFTARQDGANVVAELWIDGVLGATSTDAGTLASVNQVRLNQNLVVVTSAAHVLVGDGTTLSGLASAMDGYAGEQAHVRMVRLADEEGVLFATTAARSAAMGPQGIATFIDQLRECEAADGGVLYEKRWGLAYKSLDEYYNQPVGLALDFDQGHIGDLPEPADDDQRLRNKWTVSRTNGSDFTAEQTTGPMGTGTEGPGLYDDSITLNLSTDGQLADQANWRLSKGLVDEDRWPVIGLNFAASPELIDAFTALGYGARVTVDHPPAQMPPDQLDLIVEGHSERWGRYIWTASLNTSPASPYRIAIVEDSAAVQETPRVGSGTAVLAASYTSSDTSFSVTAGAGGLWPTDAADFPLDINIAGERIRLSAISGAADPQTFTVSARSINGVTKSQSAGARIEPWQISTVGL